MKLKRQIFTCMSRRCGFMTLQFWNNSAFPEVASVSISLLGLIYNKGQFGIRKVLGDFKVMQAFFPDVDRKITALVWGGTVSESIFKRWAQGFEWSVDERCALMQQFGGPCAVIAPVQGYFLQKLLFDESGGGECLAQNNAEADIENISDSERDKFFAMALVSILMLMNKSSWTLCVSDTSDNCKSSITEGGSSQISACLSDSPIQDFHSSLRLRKCSCETELHSFLLNDLSSFMSPFGVLKFLYSVILSKGIDNVINEMDNPDVPLIDSIHGHGSQNLINLLICGQAVSNVFDGNRDIAGLCLRGIPQPCNIGFLTLLEKLRYCTVGTYLKRPRYPVWLLGSETHLSVLFSRECSLVAPDSILDRAHKIFDRYDPEDNGFVATSLLEDLLRELDLVNEPEYVQIMCENLDPEGLGVIIRSKFFEEFFSNENKKTLPDRFDLFHYNGLSQSHQDGKVRFRKGTARHIDWQECSGKTADSAIESCLQMRWPGIWMTWQDSPAPSLN